jgi:putative phage-type endonuclease
MSNVILQTDADQSDDFETYITSIIEMSLYESDTDFSLDTESDTESDVDTEFNIEPETEDEFDEFDDMLKLNGGFNYNFGDDFLDNHSHSQSPTNAFSDNESGCKSDTETECGSNASTHMTCIETDELTELVLTTIDAYALTNPRLFCSENYTAEITHFIWTEIPAEASCAGMDSDEFDDFCDHVIHIYRETIHPLDSTSDPNPDSKLERNTIAEQLSNLRLRPQPAQRTPEWYKARSNLLSASNYYKVCGSQAAQNSIIYEKCNQFNAPPIIIDPTEPTRSVNVDTPMHWGQKYEPLSALLYEHEYNTKIEEFGCIQHDKHSCIGASPDGINCCPESPLYGRLIEIKNVVSRIITGEPKKEYFAQMQVQMEVCDLDECDFLETKFTEYPTYADFVQDSHKGNLFESNEILPLNLPLINNFEKFGQPPSCQETRVQKRKGGVIYFVQPDAVPFYCYMPIIIKTLDEFNAWSASTIAQFTSDQYKYTFVNICFWKLDVFNVVLVKRDRAWFLSTLPGAKALWQIIETERLGDYSHRAPKKRKTNAAPNTITTVNRLPDTTSLCLLSLSESDSLSTASQTQTQTQTQLQSQFQPPPLCSDAAHLFNLFKFQDDV